VREDIQEGGIEDYTQVVRRLYSGANTGKLMLKVAPE
jgi:NADPH-dependent curcumin reductase CurA